MKLLQSLKKNSNLEKTDPKIALNILSEFYFKQQKYQESYDTKLKWSKHIESSINSWFKFAEQLRDEQEFELSINAYNYILAHKLHEISLVRLLWFSKNF